MKSPTQHTSNPLTKLIERVSARIPASVTPSTRIEIHPSEWLSLVDAIGATSEPSEHPPELMEVVDKWQDTANAHYRMAQETKSALHVRDAATIEAVLRDIRRATVPPVVEVHENDVLPLEFVLDKVKELIFSKRQEFFRYLEKKLLFGRDTRIAWPDGMLHLSREEFNDALRHAEQSTGLTKGIAP